jgi:REP element-mobilizing transposase RayT
MPPLVIAYHLIITAYGFWLPNDPRGSWSDFVRSWELARFGPATKTNTKRSLAHDPHDRRDRLAAKAALARPAVEFSAQQCLAIGMGFLHYARRSGCIIHACSILPTHAHLVVMRMQYPIEQVANLLKGAACTELNRRGLHPFADQPYANGKLPTPWARHAWSCFLDSEADILRSIDYTEKNPQKENKPPQHWQCVTPYPPSPASPA